jgi:hypothetical protein
MFSYYYSRTSYHSSAYCYHSLGFCDTSQQHAVIFLHSSAYCYHSLGFCDTSQQHAITSVFRRNAYLAGSLVRFHVSNLCTEYIVFLARTPSVERLPRPRIGKNHDVILLKPCPIRRSRILLRFISMNNSSSIDSPRQNSSSLSSSSLNSSSIFFSKKNSSSFG